MKDIDEAIKQGKAVIDNIHAAKQNSFFTGPQHWSKNERKLDIKDFCLFQIKELTFEEKAPRREAMENILGTFRGVEGISFIYLILGTGNGVNFYFGIAADLDNDDDNCLSAPTIGSDLLKPGIRGNFRGCQIKELDNREKQAILKHLQNPEHRAGVLIGVPGTDKDSESFQGVDRLIDVMAEDEFGFMVVAHPCTGEEMDDIEQKLLEVADLLSPLLHNTLQRSKTDSTNENNSNSSNTMEQNSSMVQKSESASTVSGETTSHGNNKNVVNQQQSTAGRNAGSQYNINNSAGFNDSTSKNRHEICEKSGSTPKVTQDVNDGSGNNSQTSGGTSYSEQKQTSYVFSYQLGENDSTSHSTQKNSNVGNSKQESDSHMLGTSKSVTKSKVVGQSATVLEQMEVDSKAPAHWLKYIEEILLPRLDYGHGKGIFLSCAYLFAKQSAMLKRLANTAISLYSGPKGNKSPLNFYELDEDHKDCRDALENMQLPMMINRMEAWEAVLSHFGFGDCTYCANWMSAEDLGILAALPQKEVPGLALREEVEFGLNVNPVADKDAMELGNLVHNGTERDITVSLDRLALDKHTFVTGVTGSGKTTTCQNILLNSNLPFLVIEPAKTEYRILKKRCPDLLFFTPGKQEVAPFFLNPFELFPGEAITSRADMIKATLEASFDMEAAIPQIMETAVYRAYEEKGWDVRANEWRPVVYGEDNPQNPFADGKYAFPTMSEFWEAVKKVTKEEGFGERLQDEYMGSLKARIESLLVGAKGMMLDTPHSIDFNDLVKRKVVIELEEIKNGAEKSLLMGFILTNLMQAVRAQRSKDPNFQHITLVEEAHRLLSRYVPGDSMNKKHGVEVFADMLAEVRKYGESLIIADQIPDKMTPEVLKNTNTKIVHKLFARDDKDAIGDTMALADEQKDFLSKLSVGRAIVFSQGWSKAIQVKIKQEEDTTGKLEVSNDVLKSTAEQYYAEDKIVRSGVLRGIEHLPAPLELRDVQDYLYIMRKGYRLKQKYNQWLENIYDSGCLEQFVAESRHVENSMKVHEKIWTTWLYCNCYDEFSEEGFRRFKEILSAAIETGDNREEQDKVMGRLQRESLAYFGMK